MIRVLHLDDDELFLFRVRKLLAQQSFGLDMEHISVSNEHDFWQRFDEGDIDAVILDVLLGPSADKGTKVADMLRDRSFGGPVVMVSNVADVPEITDAIASGATDYITKSLDDTELAHRMIHPIRSHFGHGGSPGLPLNYDCEYVGSTIENVHKKVRRVLRSGVRSILVTGESGTGKEIVADIVSRELPPGVPFVAINCGCICASLIESELFGHEKGAFTGAFSRHNGLIPGADGGWVFLDEFARLPVSAQAALLRVLESGDVRSVGSERLRKIDIRVIAATNENLDQLVEAGSFREDLLQRVKSYEIALPPLRARSHRERQDILDFFVSRLNQQHAESEQSSEPLRLSAEAEAVLLAYPFRKGNFRELWNTLQAMAIEAEGDLLTLSCLPPSVRRELRRSARKGVASGNGAAPKEVSRPAQDFSVPVSLPDKEQELLLGYLNAIVDDNGPSVPFSRVATLVGISRWSLRSRVERLAKAGRLPSRMAFLHPKLTRDANY